MGLKDYKRWKRKQEFLEFLSEYGITEDDLFNFKMKKPSLDLTAKNEETYKNKKTPAEVLKAFEDEGTEEFYADGRRNN